MTIPNSALPMSRRFRKFIIDNRKTLKHQNTHSIYVSPHMVRVIKSRRLRLAGHLARMEEGRSAFRILAGKPTGKRPLGVVERTIFEWT